MSMNYMIHGILQARILEWVASSFFRGSSQPRDRTPVSCIASRLFNQLSHKGRKIYYFPWYLKVANLSITLYFPLQLSLHNRL